jgi:hypothetical protein
MRQTMVSIVTACLLGLAAMPVTAQAQEMSRTNQAELEKQVQELKDRVAALEQKAGPDNSGPGNPLQAAVAALKLSGGISAGFFYTSNPGQDTSDSEFLLSNLLVEISPRDKSAPVNFAAALGQTSTPSLLSTPENSDSLNIEYASLTLKPVSGLGVEVGLLQPNAGYENSYTYNNNNAFLGALASQQPYNAYGVRLGYNVAGMDLWAGYFKDRLDDEEYGTEEAVAKQSWEIGLSGTLSDTDFSLYHYRLPNLRSLTGVVIERTFGRVDMALNLDYWHWQGDQKSAHGSDAAIGAAFYVVPHFGQFSLPIRLEYIDQDKSGIYLDSVDARQIYAATVSPTYHFRDNIYVRADLGYVNADDGFADDDGKVKSDRICLAAEVGYQF